MRIAFILPRFHTNGLGWVNGLANLGHDVSIGVFRREPTEVYDRFLPDDLSSPFASTRPRVGRNLKNLVKSGRVSTPQGSTPDVGAWLNSKGVDACIVKLEPNHGSAMLLGKLLGSRMPLVAYTQQPLATPQPKSRVLFAVLQRLGIPVMSPVRTKPASSRWALAPSVGPRVWIPFAVDLSDVGRAHVHSPCRIVTVAKFRRRKRIVELVQALGVVRAEVSTPFHLTVIGECLTEREHDYAAEIMTAAAAVGLEDCLTLILNAAHGDVQRELVDADLFVLNSVDEMASVSIPEAMAAGCAVLSSEDNGTADYVWAADAGLVFGTTSRDLEVALMAALHEPTSIPRWQFNAVTYSSAVLETHKVAQSIESLIGSSTTCR